MESSVATVCQAIDVFYSGGADFQRAQDFLQAFQESTESWTICDKIIRLHTNSLACYFASQTLRTKILKKFNELPADQYEPLWDSLLHHLDRHGALAHDAQSEATATQLCLAMADLYIQVPTWNNLIFELLDQCQTLEGDRTIMTLTLLQVFPEELENIRGIGENRRTAIWKELATCEQPMFSFLSHVLGIGTFQTNADMLRRVFKCIESSLLNPQMRTDSLANSPLFSNIFQIVSTISPSIPSTLHENATNVIIAALVRAEDLDDHRKLAEVLHRGVIRLGGAFREAERQEDMDRLQNIARIFVETVESFYAQIVNIADPDPNAVGSLACFELLLLVAEQKNSELIEMSFNVWYRITEEFSKYDDDHYIGRIRPYAEKFIVSLYEHCKLDADDVDDVPDDSSEFGDFRKKAIEALRDVVFVVNSDRCIQMMHDKLITAWIRWDWGRMEAAIFLCDAVLRHFRPESDSHMPDVLQMICSLSLHSPPALISTCLTLISDLNEWFAEHHDLMVPIIPWILQFSTDPRLACQVAVCFDRITIKCAEQLIPLLPQLLTLISVLEQTQTHGDKVEEAFCSLTRAICMIISTLPPDISKLAMEPCQQSEYFQFNVAKFVASLMRATRTSELSPHVIERAIRSVRQIFRVLGPQISAFCSIVPSTFDSLARGVVFNHSDTIDTLFRFAHLLVSGGTSAFFTDSVSQVIFVSAVENLRLDHIEASKSISKFIAEVCQLVMSARKANYSDNGVVVATVIMQSQCPLIVANALWMSLFSVFELVQRDMADLLFTINMMEPQNFESWLTMATTTLPNDPVKATPEQLASFVNSVCAEKERYNVFNHTRDLAKLFI